jgi:hypothetical protein
MGLFIILLFSGGVVVQSIEAIGAMLAEIFFVFRCFFRVFREVAFQLLAAMFIAPLLQRTFQIPHLSFVGVGHCRILNLKLGGKGSKLSLWRAF